MKKKVATKFGEIEVPKTHALCPPKGSFAASPYLQELACFVGKDLPFEQAQEHLKKLGNIELGAKQIERICHRYGEALEIQSIDIQQDKVEKPNRELHYGMIDGSMILTRADGWKEVKLGRIFKASDSLKLSEKRNSLRRSDYTIHLGDHKEFFKKFELKADKLQNLVFIGDGARWIWDRVTSSYPEATQILDYFHCKEKLSEFALHAFKDESERNAWIDTQEKLLFDDKIEIVIQNIDNHPVKSFAKTFQLKLSTYFKNNRNRMQYGTYQKKGVVNWFGSHWIGSSNHYST